MFSPEFKNATSIILRRCSSAPQIENSMQNQGRTVEAAVAAHSLHVIDDIQLEGVTGSVPSLRTDIDRILKAKIIHPSLRLVVVPDSSRFTRVGSHHGQKLLYDLEAKGIFVFFVAENLINDDRISKMYLSFLFDSANQHARAIARNGTMGSERSFLDGKSPHSRLTPYGLDRLYLVNDVPQHIIRNLPDGTQIMLDPEGKPLNRTFSRNDPKGVPNHYIKQKSERILLVPGDPIRVAIVMTIFHLRYVESLGIRAIARHLNDLGVPSPTGHEWCVDTVFRISVNPVYLGIGIRNKTAAGIYSVSSGKGEPLPSKVTLEDIVVNRPQPTRRVRDQWIERPQPLLAEFLLEPMRSLASAAIEAHHQKLGAAKPIKPNKNKHAKTSNYVLSGVLKSKQGSYPMTGQSIKKSTGKLYRRYMVSRSQSVPKTNNVLSGTISADAVEPAVMNIVRTMILQRDDLQSALLKAIESVKVGCSGNENPDEIKRKIAKCQKQIVSLSKSLNGDEMIDQPLEAEMDHLKNRVRDLCDSLKMIESAQGTINADPEINIETLMAEFQQHVQKLDQSDTAAAKTLVNLVVGRLEADLVTKEVEIELSVPKSLGALLLHPTPVCLVSASACNNGHEAHPENRLKIGIHRCELTKLKKSKCYVCRRMAA